MPDDDVSLVKVGKENGMKCTRKRYWHIAGPYVYHTNTWKIYRLKKLGSALHTLVDTNLINNTSSQSYKVFSHIFKYLTMTVRNVLQYFKYSSITIFAATF